MKAVTAVPLSAPGVFSSSTMIPGWSVSPFPLRPGRPDPGGAGLGRRLTVMQTDGDALVLDDHAGAVGGEFLERTTLGDAAAGSAVQWSRRFAAAPAHARPRPRRGAFGDPVDLGEGASADDGDPTLQSRARPPQSTAVRRGRHHASGVGAIGASTPSMSRNSAIGWSSETGGAERGMRKGFGCGVGMAIQV